MRLAYPAELRELADTVLVSFPDVPEALTEGATIDDALREATDCLVAALGGYVGDGRRIPKPSDRPDALLIKLPALVAAKVALYQTMLDRRLDKAALAERIGLTEKAVERLVDLDHRSPVGQVENALYGLGLALCVEVTAVSPTPQVLAAFGVRSSAGSPQGVP